MAGSKSSTLASNRGVSKTVLRALCAISQEELLQALLMNLFTAKGNCDQTFLALPSDVQYLTYKSGFHMPS